MNLIRSLGQSFRSALLDNPGVRRIAARHPRLVHFARTRFDRSTFTGRPLTYLTVAFVYLLLLLVGVINDVVTTNAMVSVDVRTNHMFLLLRNSPAVRVFLWVTLLCKGTTIVVFVLIASSVLWVLGRRWHILVLWIVTLGAEIFTQLGKMMLHRPRPVGVVYVEHSASFPSGHAAVSVAFYGFVVYLCLHSAMPKRYKRLTVVLGLVIILAVGYSRIYLGVHYISDVLGGYLLGLLWLIIGISAVEWELRHGTGNKIERMEPERRRLSASLLTISGLIFYIMYGIGYNPALNAPTFTTRYRVASDMLAAFDQYGLSKFTETIAGTPQEPLSFLILAGGDAQLTGKFRKAGWQLSDPVRFRTTMRLFQRALFNRPYERAPMTPSFWEGRSNNFGFEKATFTPTARQRHHARFWKTDLCTQNGDTLYVGTVSLDSGLKWFITHRINPDIDAERELLFTNLRTADSTMISDKIWLTGPTTGKNFTGDPFFTDGQAYVLQFKPVRLVDSASAFDAATFQFAP